LPENKEYSLTIVILYNNVLKIYYPDQQKRADTQKSSKPFFWLEFILLLCLVKRDNSHQSYIKNI